MCHGATPQGKLDLRSQQAILNGGASGPVVVPGESGKSLLLTKVVTRQMPPGNVKLTEAEIDQIRTWIDKGLAVAAPVTVSEHEVRAIFQVRCVLCHGSGDRKGGLDMRTVASRLKGGKSGPGLVPGKPEESLIYQRIVKGQMPPDKLAKDLAVELPTASETEKIRAWIAAGAPGPEAIALPPDAVVKDADRQFWSFQPPKRPAVPTVKNQPLVRNPIDAFLLEKLEAKGLRYAREADRLALMRRAYLDVTGIPPTPAEIDAYRQDQSPDAYEKLVDRLLASPRYGERWGQHWLDLAGYSDSEGFGQDDGVRPSAWRYRDYVIRSLNADKPYTRFITEQIAGDEMSDDWKNAKGVAPQETDRPPGRHRISAHRAGPHRLQRARPDCRTHERAGRRSGSADLFRDGHHGGLRALPQSQVRSDSAARLLSPERHPARRLRPLRMEGPKKRELDLATEAERKSVTERNAPLQAEIKRIQQQIREATEPFRAQAVDEAIAALPAEVRAEVRAVADTPADKRTEAQRALAEKYKSALRDLRSGSVAQIFRASHQDAGLQKDLTTARGNLPRRRTCACWPITWSHRSHTCCSAAIR